MSKIHDNFNLVEVTVTGPGIKPKKIKINEECTILQAIRAAAKTNIVPKTVSLNGKEVHGSINFRDGDVITFTKLS